MSAWRSERSHMTRNLGRLGASQNRVCSGNNIICKRRIISCCKNSSAHTPASRIYLLLCIRIHLVYLLLEVLLQLVPLELEAGRHEPIVDAELLWDQVHCLDSLKAAQATLLADFVDLFADVFSGLQIRRSKVS